MARTSLITGAVCLLAVVATASAGFDLGSSIIPSPELVANWFAEGGVTFTGQESVPEMRRKFITRVVDWAKNELTSAENDLEAVKNVFNHVFDKSHTMEDIKNMLEDLIHSPELTALEKDVDGLFHPMTADPYPYFGFIPELPASVMVGAPAKTWSTACWGSTSAEALKASDGTITVTITVSDQKEFLCADSYLALTVASAKFGIHVGSAGAHSFVWNTTGITQAEQYDLDTKGIRLFHFMNNTLTTIGQIIDTAMLFLQPLTAKAPDAAATARNVKFMADYAARVMKPRTITEVDLPESEIQSGDFFGIIRLDGLDPMLGWAMGSTTGHTTVAIRDNGVLYVAESTAKDSYWPVNGIQRTPYAQWIAQAKAAGFQVVHAPLNAAYRAKFNATAANEFFRTVEGLNYGYHNMLWGWIDTLSDNYPCVPPYPSKKCLTWDIVEVLFSVLNKAIPALGDLMFKQAWNLRLGTVGLEPAELFMIMGKKGIATDVLPTMVEQDVWRYNTTRYGKPTTGRSMVCCVFVCHMWKAAGIFGEDFENCGEFTNLDDYSLNIFETSPPPEICQKADPGNPVCQLLGGDTLQLNEYHTKDMFPHMAEKCPSMAPKYERPPNC